MLEGIEITKLRKNNTVPIDEDIIKGLGLKPGEKIELRIRKFVSTIAIDQEEPKKILSESVS